MRALPLISAVIGFTAAAAVAIAGWAWLGRPVPMVDAPSGRLQCLSYTVSYQDASPIDPDFKAPAGLMEDDMRRLRPLTDCIRTYSSLGSQGDAVAVAADAGIQVMLGIWISANDDANRREIARAIELAKAHPAAIRSIIVGNEVLLRREMTPGRLAEYIRTVRAAVSAPVTYADIYEFWRRNAKLADDVDLVTIHVLPYWDDPTPVSIDAVQAHVQGIVDKARAAFPGKPMQIGEIGWPSAGRTRGGAEPSLVNEARFIREFARNADRIGLPYNIIEAVDQHWKRRPEGTVGGYWGILDGERRLKFPLSGPVSERPDWRLAAVFSILVGFAAAIWAPWRVPGSGMAWRPAAAAAAATLGGATLYAFAGQALDFAIGPFGKIWGGYLCALSLAGTVFVVRRLTGLAPGVDTAWFRWAVMVPAAMVALSMAVDGRHRDFLTVALLMPALALLLSGHPTTRSPVAMAWLGLIIAVAAPFGVDAWTNHEAIQWAALCLVLAAPLHHVIHDELSRLLRHLRQ